MTKSKILVVEFYVCPKEGEIFTGTASLGLMGTPLAGARSGIIPAEHVLDNLFTLECDISVLCEGKNTPSFVCPSCGKMSTKQMNE